MVHGVGALLPLAVLLASHAPCVQGDGNLEGEGGAVDSVQVCGCTSVLMGVWVWVHICVDGCVGVGAHLY